jgi:4'-phosphopantetheinyl transferase
VGCARIEVRRFDLDLKPEPLAALRATLSGDERARADRFRFARDADRFTAGRGLLRAVLAERLNEEPQALRFGYSPAGKPFLRDHPRTRFNVSGAAGAGLLAVADEIELGVDVELVASAQLVVEVADRYFAAAEIEALALLEPSQRPLACLRCWTRKEAYVKARGDGLALALDKFAVSLRPDDPAALRWSATPGEAARWSLVDVSDPAGLTVAALCYAAVPDVAATVVEIC